MLNNRAVRSLPGKLPSLNSPYLISNVIQVEQWISIPLQYTKLVTKALELMNPAYDWNASLGHRLAKSSSAHESILDLKQSVARQETSMDTKGAETR